MAKKYVTGFGEAALLLKELPSRVENRVLQQATTKAARVIAREVRASAPKGKGKQSPSSQKYGRLNRNIGVQALRNAKRRGQRGSRVWTKNAFWALFLEFGTKFIQPRPWFRPAVERSKDKATEVLAEELAIGIDREARKLAK